MNICTSSNDIVDEGNYEKIYGIDLILFYYQFLILNLINKNINEKYILRYLNGVDEE